MFEQMRELFQILNDAPPPPRLDRLRLNEAEVIIDAGRRRRGDHRAEPQRRRTA
jgi:hypothetical protein